MNVDQGFAVTGEPVPVYSAGFRAAFLRHTYRATFSGKGCGGSQPTACPSLGNQPVVFLAAVPALLPSYSSRGAFVSIFKVNYKRFPKFGQISGIKLKKDPFFYHIM
jgi:hypothetical protein